MEQDQALLVAGQELGRHLQCVPLERLLAVGDVKFGHEHRAAALPAIFFTQAEAVEHGVGGVVERQHVVGDVHVAVVVDPLREHGLAVGGPPLVPRVPLRVRLASFLALRDLTR